MSDYYTDLLGVYNTGLEGTLRSYEASHSTNKDNGTLDMQDFLTLLVAGFQNQTMDSQADVGEMMNQMVQMSVVTAISNISELITQTTNLSYAASLVGKDVVIAEKIGNETEPRTVSVTGTGTLNGKQVIFAGDESFFLSDIMAVGQLPAEKAEDADLT